MTNAETPVLKPTNPIREVVVDIECELPSEFDLRHIQAKAASEFRDLYPAFQPQFMIEQVFNAPANLNASESVPGIPPRSSLCGLRYLQGDNKQIVQIRTSGYSFNRLAPYTTFTDYIAEIQRTWGIYVTLVAPKCVRQVSLRYINSLFLPFDEKGASVNLDHYLAMGPQLTDESRLTFTGFLHRHAVLEPTSGNQATITLTTQVPVPGKHLPIILDIAANNQIPITDITDWPSILAQLMSLRDLNNHIFQRSLTPLCRQLYQSLQ